MTEILKKMMTDPLADMLTRIRNAQSSGKTFVEMPAAKLKASVCKVLKEEGYIDDFAEQVQDGKRVLRINIRYHQGSPAIRMLDRHSRPGRRVYTGKKDVPEVRGGLGVAIISTSKGVMTGKRARKLGEGGEVLCYVF